jgi:hypothetical protein
VHGGAGPGQQHEVGLVHLGRRGGPAHEDTGLGGEGVDVGGVAGARQPDGRDPQHLVRVRGSGHGDAGAEAKAVLDVEGQVLQPGNGSEGGTAGELLEHGQTRFEQARVAAELVDHEAADQ